MFFARLINENNCYCSSCANRDLYIKLFDIFVKLGGNVQSIETHSPIEKVIDQILKKQSLGSKGKKLILTDSTRSPSEGKIPKVFFEDEENANKGDEEIMDINSMIWRRKQLMRILEISKLVKKREIIKFEILSEFFG